MNVLRPNLFDFATSELSQDAVLGWCLAWADGRYATTDPTLNEIGRDLISSLFRAANIEAPAEPYSVVVRRQLEHVDIVAELGAEHLLVIEDKVHTSEHSDQLKTYAKTLTELYPERKRAFIFLKTGDQSSYSGVKADGWTTFLRKDLLAVLRRGSGCTNAIFRDFLDVLERKEGAVQGFLTAPVATWGRRDPAYVGLFTELQTQFEDGRWGYVPNASGGFLGFWWNFEEVEGGEIYLQLEEDALMAKVWVEDADRRGELRELWFRRVVDGIPGFVRPRRFGNGEYMTVATRGDYRVVGPDGRLDLDATVRTLREVTAGLSRLAGSAPPASK